MDLSKALHITYRLCFSVKDIDKNLVVLVSILC